MLLKNKKTHLNRIKVRYSEVDCQRIVYNSHYLTYFDISDKLGKNRNFGGWRKSEAEARKVKNIQTYWNYDKITRSHLPAEK